MRNYWRGDRLGGYTGYIPVMTAPGIDLDSALQAQALVVDDAAETLDLGEPMTVLDNANGVALGEQNALAIGEMNPVFELPGPLFDLLPTAIYVCDQDGLVLRYNHRAAELWGRSPKLGDPDERFCGSFRIYKPDGRVLPHRECPMADVVRTGIPVRDQEVTIERPDGSRGVALVNIEALRDTDGNVVGAVNCFQDITVRKEAEEKVRVLAREMDHRAKNLLALVQATVHLTQADNIQDFKAAIEGRIRALSNAHALLAESRWEGADLRALVTEELSPYRAEAGSRVEVEGPDVSLNPQSAQSIAMV